MAGEASLRALASASKPVWVEMTQAAHGHGGSGWEFGTCLWSPTRNRSGSDRYAIMRSPLEGDHVIHFIEDTWPDGREDMRLAGVSQVLAPFQQVDQEPPQPGDWAGRGSYYRIELQGFRRLEPALPLRRLREDYAAELLAELSEDHPRHYPFNIYRNEVRTTQGIYLTRATSRLIRLIADALGIEAAAPESALEADPPHKGFAEGQRLRREVYFFSRNPRLAAAAKRQHGYRCMACGFDFEQVYGPLGRQYIECHHLNPLSERAELDWTTELVTRVEDVAVLCANCHRMVHRQRPAMHPDALIERLHRARNGQAPSPSASRTPADTAASAEP